MGDCNAYHSADLLVLRPRRHLLGGFNTHQWLVGPLKNFHVMNVDDMVQLNGDATHHPRDAIFHANNCHTRLHCLILPHL